MSLAATPRATVAVLRGLIDEARRKDYTHGAFAVRAQPVWTDADTFVHEGTTVRVVPCISSLAVREALLEQEPGTWLVVLTDRTEEDLGYGLLAHLLWNRLRTPDPWAILRQGFAATGLDPALTAAPGGRDLAAGILAVAPREPERWPPAPAGTLTRDHAFGAVAARILGLSGPGGATPDAAAVLDWSASTEAAAAVAALRGDAGDVLADALLDWLADRTGAQGPFVRHLLRSGDLRDVVPLGLVVDVLQGAGGAAGSSGQLAREAMVRLEARLGGRSPDPTAARAWAADASSAARRLIADPDRRADQDRVLARADELLTGCQAGRLAVRSLELPSALTMRLDALGESLRTATAHLTDSGDAERAARTDLDAPLVVPEAAAAVEAAWAAVQQHRLWSPVDRRATATIAAVRLVRWLAGPAALGRSPGGPGIAGPTRRQLDADAWVDSAVHDAERGVGDAELGAALAAVLAAARLRRRTHDLRFAVALTDHTRAEHPLPAGGSVQHLEDALPRLVLPLARTASTLLLVLDGMSAAVATEVIGAATATDTGWSEALWREAGERVAALAVLPTLTRVSRASLFCGELQVGEQQVEQTGFAALTGALGIGSRLFHKKDLDTSRPGHELAAEVAAAVDDVDRLPLVACVLNTIDDALDRSDPGGTDWNLGTIRHLRPLLDRARLAGRVVVMTSDHGHVIERRAGTGRTFPDTSSGRSRAASSGPAGEGEVLVEGRRVLDHGGRAVLAVDELLRYGPIKAGYHGGGNPAEVVVPVAFLVPGAVPEGVDLLALAPPQEPAWWDGPATVGAVPAVPVGVREPAPAAAAQAKGRGRQPVPDGSPTLFDVSAAEPAASVRPAPVAGTGTLFAPLADAVVSSPVYATQKRLAGRGVLGDEQIAALLTGLLGAPGQRLGQTQVASALRIPPAMFRGALAQVQRLLNVEGYTVIGLDVDGSTTVLDEALLREQFGVAG